MLSFLHFSAALSLVECRMPSSESAVGGHDSVMWLMGSYHTVALLCGRRLLTVLRHSAGGHDQHGLWRCNQDPDCFSQSVALRVFSVHV